MEDEIALEIDCFVPQELSIQPDVLAVILGNCLDNSISACLRLTDKSERTLSLNIYVIFNKIYLFQSTIPLMNRNKRLVKHVKEMVGACETLMP